MRTACAWASLGIGFLVLFDGHKWVALVAIIAWLILLNENAEALE